MDGSGQRGDLAPRFAWTFAAAFLCLILPARLAFAAYWTGTAGVAVAVALFVLPLLYTVPRGRRVWDRHRGWLLTAQAVGTFLPLAIFGPDWVVPLTGLLGGLLLLTLSAPTSWLLFAAVLAADVVLGSGRTPIRSTPLSEPIWPVLVWLTLTTPAIMALALFGLVRLADLVTDLHATRTALAGLAVSQQRLRSAGRLRTAIGDRLQTITAHAHAALGVLATDPEQARGQLTKAASVARQALDQARAVAADNDRDPDPPPETGQAGDTVAPRLARLVLMAVLCVYTVWLLVDVAGSGTSTRATADAAGAITLVLTLQLYHTLARREGARPRGWALTLTAQTLLSIAFFLVFDEVSQFPLAGFAAGSALLLLPGRWAWAAFTAIVASVGTLSAIYSPYGFYDVMNLGAVTAAYGLMVYGLSRLTDLAHEVEAARQELAWMALAQERLRLSRDTHDLLGLGLSTIALKCDLIMRLIGRDNANAHSQLEQLLQVAAKAHGDLRSVTGEAEHRLSLHTELAAASETLNSAGVEVRIDVPTAPLPTATEAVLATVLREAVTNILRHTAARQCTIRLSTTEDVIRLHITNDGVRAPDAPTTGGAGVANLRARVHALGGHLTAGPDGQGEFELTAEIPVTP